MTDDAEVEKIRYYHTMPGTVVTDSHWRQVDTLLRALDGAKRRSESEQRVLDAAVHVVNWWHEVAASTEYSMIDGDEAKERLHNAVNAYAAEAKILLLKQSERLTPPDDAEVEAIRARVEETHQTWESVIEEQGRENFTIETLAMAADEAEADRSTLLCALDAAKADLAALREERRDEHAWLIEATTPDSKPTWYTADLIPWSFDADKALRFSRQKDAEAVIASWPPSIWPWMNTRATEHAWSPMPTPKGDA
jgi:hypothetical protein